MVGSLDCMHTVWKNCPTAWQGSFQGKEGKPTIVLEGMCDYHLWFWHVAYGYAGTLNDLTILSLSTLLESMLDGSFHDLEGPWVPYKICDEEFTQLFMLVDGIYPQYSRFVKGFKEPITKRESKFSEWQEACRKDIERAFGVLQGKFQCMSRPFHQMTLDLVGKRVACCLILHNMCVADRVMDGDVRARYKPDNTVVEDPTPLVTAPNNLELVQGRTKSTDRSTIGVRKGNKFTINLVTRKERWNQLDNPDEFVRLTKAIMDLTETMTNPRIDKVAGTNN
jgi:hypothetical protein